MAKKSGRKPKDASAETSESSSDSPLPPALESKSGAIKSYLEAHPAAKSAEVVDALKETGLEVTPNYVSMVKSKAGLGRKRKAASKKPASSPSTNGQADPYEAIKAAVGLIKAAGSLEHARSALKIAGELVDVMK